MVEIQLSGNNKDIWIEVVVEGDFTHYVIHLNELLAWRAIDQALPQLQELKNQQYLEKGSIVDELSNMWDNN